MKLTAITLMVLLATLVLPVDASLPRTGDLHPTLAFTYDSTSSPTTDQLSKEHRNDGFVWNHAYDADGNQVINSRKHASLPLEYDYDTQGNNTPLFSSMHYDAHTGHYFHPHDHHYNPLDVERWLQISYWGYRFYSPSLGRWVSRDPVNEIGSMRWFEKQGFLIRLKSIAPMASNKELMNLYSFCLNNSVAKIDTLGLTVFETIHVFNPQQTCCCKGQECSGADCAKMEFTTESEDESEDSDPKTFKYYARQENFECGELILGILYYRIESETPVASNGSCTQRFMIYGSRVHNTSITLTTEGPCSGAPVIGTTPRK